MDHHLIVVGRYKNSNFEQLEADYLKRINNPKLIIHQVKADAQSPDKEDENVLKQLNQLQAKNRYKIFLLNEHGSSYSSTELAKKLSDQTKPNIYIISGAMGHGEKLCQKADELLSLSPLTMPHKIARLVFVEQFYRLQTIRNDHPYHHA